MISDAARFAAAIERFDAANAADPRRVPDSLTGQAAAAAVLYARRMTDWLGRLYPDASESLRLAARAQHIRRWAIPRESYPMDRAGYHQWRTTLYAFHADAAGAILRDVGYDEATIARVRSLIRKERLKADPDAQALEDTICLVFLESEFADFAAKHEADKVVNILKRTWAKMSPVGHAAAATVTLPAEAAALVGRSLGG